MHESGTESEEVREVSEMLQEHQLTVCLEHPVGFSEEVYSLLMLPEFVSGKETGQKLFGAVGKLQGTVGDGPAVMVRISFTSPGDRRLGHDFRVVKIKRRDLALGEEKLKLGSRLVETGVDIDQPGRRSTVEWPAMSGE